MRELRRPLSAALVPLLLFVAPATADTISAERIAKTTRLLPLAKVTVGPDDQYQGVLDGAGRTVIFTRKTDLVPHLWRQDLQSGEAVPVLDLSADSQQPTLSPNGTLAFVYYRFNSRGDVCYKPLGGFGSTSEPTCIPPDDGERSSPFWKSDTELGYSIRKVGSLDSTVMLFDLTTSTKNVLTEGKIWSPTMSPGGRYVFLNAAATNGRKLIARDLETGTQKEIAFPLPGVSAFPAVDESGRWLYFSHFLNDTNDDGVIDGDDNGVVFRVPFEPNTGATAPMAEQLTSAESNCSYPRPAKDTLYLTCAFEGSLDLYRIPLSGVIPASWSADTLWSAHRTARSYHERILLLNTLVFRFKSSAPADLPLRLFSNHLLAGDVAAARYYLGSLRTEQQGLAKILLDGRERFRSIRAQEPSREVLSQLLVLDGLAGRVRGPESLRRLVRGHLNAYAARTAEAASFLRGATATNTANPLERYLWVELATLVLPKAGRGKDLDAVYRAVIAAPELTEEAHLAYAFQFVADLERLESDSKLRLMRLDAAEKAAAEPVKSLYAAERAALKLSGEKEPSDKEKQYRVLDKLMSASRANYYLRKALYVRAILIFTANAEFKYLSYIATNWLRFTKTDDTEFAHAREVVVNSQMDRAYDAVGKGNTEFAGNFFFGSLSLTDELESHAGYVRSMLRRKVRPTLLERYENLREQNFIQDNQKFIDALMVVMLDGGGWTTEAGAIDTAIGKLESMTQDRDSAVRHLFLGWCYLEKMKRTANAYYIDDTLLRDSHRSLMLALDIGRDNDRIRAAALTNLAALHQRAQNYGLATRFFERRKPLGFVTATERALFAWSYAKSLFYGYRLDEAFTELEAGLVDKSDGKITATIRNALEERQAFVLAMGGKGKAASERYDQLFAAGRFADPANYARGSLAAGYAAFRAGDKKSAKEKLRRAETYASKLQPIPAGGDRLIEFRPERIRLIATGLLAQLETGTAKREALATRGALLKQFSDIYADTSTLLIQNRLQLADAWLSEGKSADGEAVHALLLEALKEAETLGKGGQWIGQPVFRAASAYLVRGLNDRQRFLADDPALARRVVEASIKAMASQPTPQPTLDFQRSKLSMLWAAYEARVLAGTTPDKPKLRAMIVPGSVNAADLEALSKTLAE